MKYIFLFPALFYLSCQDQTKEPSVAQKTNDIKTAPADTGFAGFWQKFRTAVLSSDTTQIAAMTEFPLQANGTLDSDPVVEYNRDKFVKVFVSFLNQVTYKGKDAAGVSQLGLIQNTQNPQPGKEELQHNTVMIANMVFCKKASEWKLCVIYLKS
jgi:hypothetical protein